MPRAWAVLIALVIILIYAAFIWWTVQRLWQPTNDPYARVVYSMGVRQAGLIMWLVFSITGAIQSPVPLAPWVRALLSLFIDFPLCLWVGYLFGRFMAWVYGLPPSSQ